MANNDEAGGSGGKAFWKLSQEMEEQPHLYEDTAFPTDPETTDSTAEDDPTDATTDGAAEDATTDDGSARTDGSQPKRQLKDRRRESEPASPPPRLLPSATSRRLVRP